MKTNASITMKTTFQRNNGSVVVVQQCNRDVSIEGWQSIVSGGLKLKANGRIRSSYRIVVSVFGVWLETCSRTDVLVCWGW
jgi:hypothetical protein